MIFRLTNILIFSYSVKYSNILAITDSCLFCIIATSNAKILVNFIADLLRLTRSLRIFHKDHVILNLILVS